MSFTPPLSLAPPPSPSTHMPKAAYATSAFYQKHGAKGPANMSNTSSCHGSIKPCDRPLPARGKEKARSRNKKEKTQREVRTSCPQYTQNADCMRFTVHQGHAHLAKVRQDLPRRAWEASSTNYLNVIASGISYHGVLDEFHPVWYVFPRIYAL